MSTCTSANSAETPYCLQIYYFPLVSESSKAKDAAPVAFLYFSVVKYLHVLFKWAIFLLTDTENIIYVNMRKKTFCSLGKCQDPVPSSLSDQPTQMLRQIQGLAEEVQPTPRGGTMTQTSKITLDFNGKIMVLVPIIEILIQIFGGTMNA